MSKKKKVLILGGEGYIGRNIADSLGSYYDCYSVGIEKSKFKERKDKFVKINPYKKSIKSNYDVVIHLIDNKVDLKHFAGEEKKLTKNIGLNKKNHLIIFSSAAVYTNSESEYARRKVVLEKFYSNYCKRNNIILTIFRLFNTYGLYQVPNKQGSLIANIFCNYLNRKPTEINDESAKRDFIFAKDIGKFVNWAIKNSPSKIVDLASNRLASIGKVVELIEKDVIKNKILLIDKQAKEKIICPRANNILLKKIKITPLDIGLKKTLNFYKKNIKLINKN